VRQAKHEERVRRTELGEEGLEAERRRHAEELLAEEAARKQAQAERTQAEREEHEAASRGTRLEGILRANDLAAREAGQSRFYFTLSDGEIVFVDVADTLARRLAMGDAAIVDGRGILQREFAIVSGKVAVELEAIDRSRILMWNARGA
jgi:uncharacterized protein YaiL (DUF2058 family)